MKKEIYNATYELLNSIANYLQDPGNEVFELLEDDDSALNVAAKACVISSQILKKAIFDIQLSSGVEYEPENPQLAEGVDKVAVALGQLAELSNSLDESGDETQAKTASVLDDILFTLASSSQQKEEFKKNYENKINSIRNASSSKKEEEKKEYKAYKRILQEPLSSRYCPNCPGSSLARLDDNLFGCGKCFQKFNFQDGFTKLDGTKVPGGSIANQTNLQVSIPPAFYSEEK